MPNEPDDWTADFLDAQRQQRALNKTAHAEAERTSRGTFPDKASKMALPEKRPLHREVPPPAPYPLEALGPLADAAKAAAALTQASPAMSAQSVLAAATLAAQAHADVMLPHGAVRPLSQFFLTVAGSGERKTTCDSLALRAIHEVEEEWRAIHEGAIQEYRRDLAAFKEAADEATKRARKHGRAAIKEALAATGDEPREPLRPVLILDDLTPDGLALHLEKSRPWCGIFSAEGGGFMGGHSMNDENRMRMGAMLNAAWDGAPIKRTRVLTGFSLLPGRRLSFHLMAQESVASKLLNDRTLNDIGLLARCLTVAPESTVGGRVFQEPDYEAQLVLENYTVKLGTILRQRPITKPDNDQVLDPRILECCPEARALWIAFYDETESAMAEGNLWAPIRSFAAKLAEHAARLAGVLTIYGAHDLAHGDIGASEMANGITLARFYASEALRLHGAATVAPDRELASRLLQWWQNQPERRLHLAAIYQFGPNAIRAPDVARRIVRILEEDGHTTRLPPGTVVGGAARTDAWELVPD